MKFVAEFYLKKVNKITHEFIEAESLEGAADQAEGMTNDYKSLMYVSEVER